MPQDIWDFYQKKPVSHLFALIQDGHRGENMKRGWDRPSQRSKGAKDRARFLRLWLCKNLKEKSFLSQAHGSIAFFLAKII